jgi:phosphatidylserine decarboxylase
MATPLHRGLSLTVGWLADRRIPTRLRAPVYRTYARLFAVDLEEARPPLEAYASLGAFFCRRLKDGRRPLPADPALLPSPVDGTVQSIDRIERDTILQAKGSPYELAPFVGDAARAGELEGGHAWTIYLSPRDYHRIHSPEDVELRAVERFDGAFRSVAPGLLARRPRVLATNERAALRLEGERGPLVLVLVGALNVGRIRVVGTPQDHSGPLARPQRFARGAELARFEMGSTIVLLAPSGGPVPLERLAAGQAVRMGEPIGRLPG